MAEEQFVFSEIIAQDIEGDLDALESRKESASTVMDRLRAAIVKTRARGVPDGEIVAALKKNGVKLSLPVFHKLLKDGRTGKAINTGKAQSATRKLNGEDDPPSGGVSAGSEAGAN